MLTTITILVFALLASLVIVSQFPQRDVKLPKDIAGLMNQLDQKEQAAFNRWWEQFRWYYAIDGRWPIYQDEPHKRWALSAVVLYKIRTGLTFRGSEANQSGTYGVREIELVDVSIGENTNLRRWDEDWTSLDPVLLFGGSNRDSATPQLFSDAQQVRTRDTSDRIWYIDIWGWRDLVASAGKLTRIISKIGTTDFATRYIEWPIRMNELRIHLQSERYAIREQGFKFGAEVQVTGTSALSPIGIMVANYERLTNQDISQQSRPQVVS